MKAAPAYHADTCLRSAHHRGNSRDQNDRPATAASRATADDSGATATGENRAIEFGPGGLRGAVLLAGLRDRGEQFLAPPRVPPAARPGAGVRDHTQTGAHSAA